MRNRIVIALRSVAIASLLGLVASVFAPTAADGAGVPAGLRLAGLRGGELTSAELGRETHVLVVWASWSPRCRDIVDRIGALESHWGARARVASVDFQEPPEAVEEFLRGNPMRAPVYLDRDGEFSKSLEVTTLPGLVVVRDGEIRFQGRLPADVDSLLGDLLR